jgi:transposase
MADLTAVPAGIAAQDWAHTPEAIRVVVAEVAALREENAQLKARLAALEERVGKSARNSSLPPSADGPRVPKGRKRQPSGRTSGGQPGHEGHGRALLALAHVDEVVDVRPLACAGCGTLLLGEDPAPGRQQVTEVPVVRPRVTE